MIAGIVIDPWKLDIFKKHLDRAKRVYEVIEGNPVTTIQVECDSANDLLALVRAAQNDCFDTKKRKMH